LNPGSQSFTAACVQVNTGNDLNSNIDSAVRGIAQAALDGADFVTLPENVAMMPGSSAQAKRHASDIADHPAVDAFQSAARAAGVLVVFVKNVYSTEHNFYLSDAWLEQADWRQARGSCRSPAPAASRRTP